MNSLSMIPIPQLADEVRVRMLLADGIGREPTPQIGGQLRVDRSPIGSGKTTSFLKHVADSFLSAGEGDKPRVAFLAPTQALAGQIRRGVDDLLGSTATTGSWFGLGYVNPDPIENPLGATACAIYSATRDAQAAGGILKNACRSGGEVCNLADTCKVYEQRFPEVVPDVVSTVHAVAPFRMDAYANALKGEGKKRFDLTVIDESPVTTFVPAGDVHVRDLRATVATRLSRDDVYRMLVSCGWKPAGAPETPLDDRELVELQAAEADFAAPAFRAVLSALDNAAARVEKDAADNRISLLDFGNINHGTGIARLIALLEYHLILLNRPPVSPNAIGKADKERYKAARDLNEPLMALRSFLKALVECIKRVRPSDGSLHGIWVQVPTGGSAEGAVVQFSKRHLPNQVFQGDQLLLSATVQPEILAALWENAPEDITPPEQGLERPHETVVRVRDKSGFPMGALVDDGKLTPLSLDIIRYVNGLAAQFHGQGSDSWDGYICVSKEMKLLLEGDPDHGRPRLISERVAVGNFRAVEGSNAYKDVRFQMIISRPQPNTYALQLQAEILAGEVIENDSSFWEKCQFDEYPTDHDEARDGPLQPLQGATHAHPMMAAVLRETTHSAVVQADRGRGSLRDEDRPLLTIFMNDVPIPHAVDRHITLKSALHWSVLCAMQGVLPDLSQGGRGVAEALCHFFPERYADTEAVNTTRRDEYDDVYACPFDSSWHLKFRAPDARYFSHVVVNASSKPEAVKVLRAALPDGEWEIGGKQHQPQLREALAAVANKEIETWNR